MNTSTKIAMAVAGGYVLGRRRKVKMAILLGSVLLGRRLNLGSLGREAMGKVVGSPAFGQIRDELRGDLASTGRAAATAVLSAPLEKLADRLHERTAALNGGGDESGDGGRTHDKARDEGRADEGEDEQRQAGDGHERRARRRPDRDEDQAEESPRRRRAVSRSGDRQSTPRGERTGARRVPTRAGARSARR